MDRFIENCVNLFLVKIRRVIGVTGGLRRPSITILHWPALRI